MNITELKQIQRSVVIAKICDVCKTKSTEPYPKDWYNFSHGHSEWGNDSGDSIETFDVCSPECYFEQLKKSEQELRKYKFAEIDGKPILFIQKMLII